MNILTGMLFVFRSRLNLKRAIRKNYVFVNSLLTTVDVGRYLCLLIIHLWH